MLRTFENSVLLDHPLNRSLEVIGREPTTIGELERVYSRTPFASFQSDLLPRFHPYLWNDVDKFKEMFGPDVDPYEHGSYQARTVAIPLIDAQRDSDGHLSPTPVAAEMLVGYCVMHDWHEGLHAFLRGDNKDVPQAKKTEANAIDEFELWQKMIINMFGIANSTQLIKYATIFEGNEGPPGRQWDAIERVGYLMTAAQAWHLADNEPNLTVDEKIRSSHMAREVMGRQLLITGSYRSEMPFVDDFLTRLEPYMKAVQSRFQISREELMTPVKKD